MLRERLLANQPKPLPEIRPLSLTQQRQEIIRLNGRKPASDFVAAGIFTPRDGIELKGYAIAGICQPFLRHEYESYQHLLKHPPQSHFFKRHFRKVADRLIFNHPNREVQWYEWRSTILFILMAATLMTWALIFYLNPFETSIRHYADDFAENFANLGEDPQQGVEHSVIGVLSVIVYVAVTQSIVTLAVLFGWLIDLFTRPSTSFMATFDKGAYFPDSPNDIERGRFLPDLAADQAGNSHEVVRAHGRWWLVETKPELLVRDEQHSLLPVSMINRGGEPLLVELQRNYRLRATNRILAEQEQQDDLLESYSLLQASVKKTIHATGMRSLLVAASDLAKSIQQLSSVFVSAEKLSESERAFAALLTSVPRNENQNAAQYLQQIAELAPDANDGLAQELCGLAERVTKSITELHAPLQAAHEIQNPDLQRVASRRLINGVDLMGEDDDPDRSRFQELGQRIRK